MAKVTEGYLKAGKELVTICDVSPPRSGDPHALAPARVLEADFLCVGYNPGKSVRADSAIAAYELRRSTGRSTVFNLGTRDMNSLALQTHLLGAQMLGLENVVVVQGDAFSSRELEQVTSVGDLTATGLIQAVRTMNDGRDHRGLKLRAPTDFCIGAAIDLGRELEGEARLTHRKALAGAHFFITQPIYDLAERERFLELYEKVAGEPLSQPVFWGLQVLAQEGLMLGSIPSQITAALERGREGTEIALELLSAFVAAGVRGVYLVPPILKGGTRDYASAQRVLEAAGQ